MQKIFEATSKRSSLITLSLGTIIISSFAVLLQLPTFRGPQVISFLLSFAVASIAYAILVARIDTDQPNIKIIWLFAIIFRILLLLTRPSLSDDIYRYIWDGHIFNQGVNPYYAPVNSPELDEYDTPLREFVNHNWMASPYLPAAQIYFGAITFISNQSQKAFQLAAVLFDLLTGLLILDILRSLKQPGHRVAIYLWNPLIIIEFAHSAHIDAFMVAMIMAAFWLLIKARRRGPTKSRYLWGSVLAMVLATLTKGIPLLLLPVFVWRWGWSRVIGFFTIIASATYLFAIKAGWGVVGELNGRGVFGALRIYLNYWKFNSSIYQFGDGFLARLNLRNGLLPFWQGEYSSFVIKVFTLVIILAASLIIIRVSYEPEKDDRFHSQRYFQKTMILAAIPTGLFLFFTATVHPWYITIILPFLVFFLADDNKPAAYRRFLWPWIFISLAIPLSYISYYDINNFREIPLVSILEYVPFYGLLIWASIPGLKTLLSKNNDKNMFKRA